MSTPQNPNTAALAQAGVSIWLDDLSRTRLDEGTLEKLIATRSVTGVTTNPSIFAVALADAGAYQGQLRDLAAAGASVDEAVVALTTEDVRRAQDRWAPRILADDWTAVTRDKSLSAQFEHSIGVTADGAEIFTLSDKFFPELD